MATLPQTFHTSAINVLQEIIVDRTRRMDSSYYKRDHDQLNRGVYNPEQYAKALKQCGLAQQVFGEYADPNFFKRLENRDKSCFRIHHGLGPVSATGAIKSLRFGLAIINSDKVIDVVYLFALRQILGEKFDHLFGVGRCLSLLIGGWIPQQRPTFDFFLKRVETTGYDMERDFQVGNIVTVLNVPSYKGKLDKVTVIQMEYNKFFGLDFPEEGVNKEDVDQFLKTAYNLAATAVRDMHSIHSFREANGGQFDSVFYTVDFERIQTIFQLSIEQAAEYIKDAL